MSLYTRNSGPQNWGPLIETKPSGIEGVVDLQNTKPFPNMLVSATRTWSFYASKGVNTNRGEPKIGERRGSAALAWEAWLTPRNTPIRTLSYMPNVNTIKIGLHKCHV